MLVCHKCDNPPCVNVSHLFLGTHAENNADMRDKGRGALPPPSPRGERNAKAKMTAEKVREMRQLYRDGWKQVDLAERFGVFQGTVSQIIRRKTWTHVA
jgi:hypothetical protein